MTTSQSSPMPSLQPLGHRPLDPSSCSIRSTHSAGTVRHHRLRSLSGSSLSSLTSLWAPPFRRQGDRDTSRSLSSTNLTLNLMPTPSESRSRSRGYSRRASFASILSSRLRTDSTLGSDAHEQRLGGVEESEGEVVDPMNEDASRRQSGGDDDLESAHQFASEETHNDSQTAPDASTEHTETIGLRRWISTLRRRKRNKQSPSPIKPRTPWTMAQESQSEAVSPSRQQHSRHKASDSQGSSLVFVTAMKSATATIASFSIATVSRRETWLRREHQRSSLLSGSDPRLSIDSQRSIADEAARQRSRKRRAKLHELIRSEEGYLTDVKALSKVSRSATAPRMEI